MYSLVVCDHLRSDTFKMSRHGGKTGSSFHNTVRKFYIFIPDFESDGKCLNIYTNMPIFYPVVIPYGLL